MELQNENIVRPWQGTLLGIVNIIGLVMAAFMVLLLMFGSSFLAGFVDEPDFAFIFGLGALFLMLLVIPFIILGVFVTIGIFKGQRWAVIVMLVFTAIALLSALANIFTGTEHHAWGSLIINGFVFYCEIAVLKDPYYK